ncbi:serine/threonine protein kinase [Pendulispora rubella]|uniref:non-specific serine/threonine protein kinase n=1 Tax=Pendulispora rubella TaxID=2741070 RepID=A0ABZ2LNH6_9BACT
MLFPDEQHPSAIGGFEVLERIGSGGAGKVYLARSKGGRLVAVKVLSDNARADPEESATLAREASLCVRLSHPAIVQVRALVQEEGVSALVFDYVEGVAMGRLLRFLSGRGERLSDVAAWHIVERILAALDYAHHQTPPIVHRDVTPANVLLDWAGDAKLTDFGMAKMLGAAPETQLGLIKGTLGCMAPEQARGDPVTERADVYAAALLAWRLATGFAPFGKYRNDEVEMLRAMKNPRIPPLAALRPDLPPPLTDAVARALEPDPELRSITAEEFRRAVSTHVNTEPGREELAVVLAAVREDLARPTPMGGFNIEGDQGASTGSGSSQGGVPTKEVTSRYSDVAVERDAIPGEAAVEPVALKPFSPDFSPEKVPPITGIAPALVVQEALRRDDDPGPRRSYPSLSAQAASQTTASRLSLSGIGGIGGNLRTRRRRARSQVILTLVFVAFIFFVVGFALGLAMHR